MKQILICLILTAGTTAFAAKPCGLNGSLETRIKDCNYTSGSAKEFQLVVRTPEGYEIYMGRRTGVVWSADLAGVKNYLGDRVEKICARPHPEFGGLDGLRWKLPPIHRYIQGLKYGIQSGLPGLKKRAYWTSTPDDFYVNSRYVFEGSERYEANEDGLFSFRHLEIEDGRAHVKCIAETIRPEVR